VAPAGEDSAGIDNPSSPGLGSIKIGTTKRRFTRHSRSVLIDQKAREFLITRPLPLRLAQGGAELDGYTIKYGRTASVNL
jgi:hypothetical protein